MTSSEFTTGLSIPGFLEFSPIDFIVTKDVGSRFSMARVISPRLLTHSRFTNIIITHYGTLPHFCLAGWSNGR
jgi:hypothetical protein